MPSKVCRVVSAHELIRAGEGGGRWGTDQQNIEYLQPHLLNQIFILFNYF
jgi:hypothetical protein